MLLRRNDEAKLNIIEWERVLEHSLKLGNRVSVRKS